MAAATYTTDLTPLVADSSTTNNWAALGGGGAGLAIETDYFIQGTRCVSKAAWAGAEKGMIEDTTNATLTASSGKAVYTWITHQTPNSLATKAAGGLQVIMGTSSATYNKYYYAGSDTIDYGAPWICAVVDPDQGTQASGTVTTANITCYGGLANLPSGGPTKGAPFGLDEIRYGRNLYINDGAGAPANFTDLAAQNDSINNRWGMVQRTPGSTTNFTMQCRLEFGDTPNTAGCVFTDSNRNITINDLEHVASNFIVFDITQGSTVNLTNCNFTATAGANTRGNWLTTSSTSVSLTGCTFANMGTFALDGNTTATDCTFRGCDQITTNGATLDGCIVTNSTNSTALVASDLGDLVGCDFISAGTGHAIELTSLGAGTMQWSSFDSGYAATDGSTGNETIYVNVGSGNLTINVATGATTPTIRTAGATVNVVAGQVTLTITVVDAATGSPIEGAMVYVTADAGATTIINKVETNSSGQVSDTRSLGTAKAIAGTVRAASPNSIDASHPYTKFYKPSAIAGTFSNLADTDITVQMIED